MLLHSKVCIVTGATKGIGAAITLKLLSEGAIVYGISRSENDFKEQLSKIDNEQNNRFHFIAQDVCDQKQMRLHIQQIFVAHKRIDVLINNAGIVSYEMIPYFTSEHIQRIFEVNVFATLTMVQTVSKFMQKNEFGSIINISSLVSTRGAEGQALYSASKGAINSFTKSAAKEFAPYKIRVNAIAPGMIATDRLVNEMNSRFDHVQEQIGMKRLGKPSEIAELCCFLASDSSQYITGQIIEIDGSTRI